MVKVANTFSHTIQRLKKKRKPGEGRKFEKFLRRGISAMVKLGHVLTEGEMVRVELSIGKK